MLPTPRAPHRQDHGFNLLNRLLAFDPRKRLSAKVALEHPWFKEVPLPSDRALIPTLPKKDKDTSELARDRRKARAGSLSVLGWEGRPHSVHRVEVCFSVLILKASGGLASVRLSAGQVPGPDPQRVYGSVRQPAVTGREMSRRLVVLRFSVSLGWVQSFSEKI